MIELGDKVKDVISGLTGIVYQISECLHGCRRIQIEPDKLNKEGGILDGWWMDEHRLKVVKKGVLQAVKAIPATATAPEVRTGGPNVRASR